MTRVEFDKCLSEIDFNEGVNTDKLENYLLGCLSQLEVYRHKKTSYELFLKIYTQARSGSRVEFDLLWKELYNSEQNWLESEWDNLTDWERVVHELRSLATDLINTREVRSQPDYIEKKMTFEWDSEGGVRFYNGTTPDSILGYAATRFEGEYSPTAYQEREIMWSDFTDPLWIGISYE